MKLILVVVMSFLISGCVASVTSNDIRNAYFGQKPDEQEKIEIITNYVKARLIDPDSLKLECASPRKGWVRPSFSDPVSFGYVFGPFPKSSG